MGGEICACVICAKSGLQQTRRRAMSGRPVPLGMLAGIYFGDLAANLAAASVAPKVVISSNSVLRRALASAKFVRDLTKSDFSNMPSDFQTPAASPTLWALDPQITHLNHGAFGACPRAILDFQRDIRLRLESEPTRFLVRELEPLLDAARTELARFVGAPMENLVMVQNATVGVNAVLRSLRFEPGDEILVTDHEYNATRNVINYVAERTGARVVVASIPFPLQREDIIVEAILAAVTPKTKIVVVDHVTSQTGLIFPVARLASELATRGIDLLIDGAHAPGMLALDVQALGAAYYTGNCHKWLFAPKGAAFLYVRPDRQEFIRPAVISHGANSARKDRSRFQIEFGWVGTGDPSAWLAVPEAIRFMEKLLPGGWSEIRERNHALVLAGRDMLCRALGCEPPCPDELLGSLASLPLPPAPRRYEAPLFLDPLQDALLFEHNIEVPIIPWPSWPGRILRISAQVYNCLPQYAELAAKLPADWS